MRPFILCLFTICIWSNPVLSDEMDANQRCLVFADALSYEGIRRLAPMVEQKLAAIGHCVRFHDVPINRAHRMFAQQESDGLVARSTLHLSELSLKHITPQAPIAQAWPALVALKGTFKNAREASRYPIGVIKDSGMRQFPLFQSDTIRMVEFDFQSPTSPFELLQAGRFMSYALDSYSLNALQEQGVFVRESHDVFRAGETRKSYMVFQPKHATVIEALDQIAQQEALNSR